MEIINNDMNGKNNTSTRQQPSRWLPGFAILAATLLAIASCSKTDMQPVLPEVTLPDTLPSLAVIDDSMASFMERFDIPGASIAVVKDGKLVYAKGYGYADQSAGELVDTSSLFRIASLSKFVTAVGIMTLIEDGLLTMDDTVFGSGGVLGNDFFSGTYPAFVEDITVRHLLHHENGGWGNSSADPAFAQPTLDVNQLISWAIANRPLTVQPGTAHDYSNLGFQILGRIIEKVSGDDYVDYIQTHVLAPAGITNMQIGGTKLAEKKPGEVTYYGQSGQNPYGYANGVISRLESCGGWIASAIDLMRLMVHADGFTTVPDILDPATINLMSTPSANSNYACGVRISSIYGNWFHGGSLSGTRTWMVRTYHGYSWAILLNSRSTATNFTSHLDARLVWPAVNNASTPWPTNDLF